LYYLAVDAGVSGAGVDHEEEECKEESQSEVYVNLCRQALSDGSK
jgi:hypothetical protein